jgi:hypothetical protein
MLARFCEHFSCGGFFEINLNGCVPAESASRACVSWLMYGLRHSRFSAPLTEFYLKIYLGYIRDAVRETDTSRMVDLCEHTNPDMCLYIRLTPSQLAVFPYMFATCVFIRVLLVFSQFSTQNSTDQQHNLFKNPTTVQRHTSHFYCHTTTTIK